MVVLSPNLAMDMQLDYEADDCQLTAEDIEQIRKIAEDKIPTGRVVSTQSLLPGLDRCAPKLVEGKA